MSGKEERCGALFVAVGSHYKYEVLVAARRVRQVMPELEVLVYADWKPEEVIDGVEFRPVERATRSFLDKVVLLDKTPFDRTLFLDTDIWLVEPIQDVISLLDQFDIVGGYDSARLHDQIEGIPDAYPEINTGLVAYRKTDEVLAFLRDVAETYEPMQNEVAGDQTAFRICLYRSGLRVHALPPEYNCQVRTAGYVTGRVRVLHARNIGFRRVEKKLNSSVGRRVFVASPWGGIRVIKYSETKMKLWSVISVLGHRLRNIGSREKRSMPFWSKR